MEDVFIDRARADGRHVIVAVSSANTERLALGIHVEYVLEDDDSLCIEQTQSV